MGTLMNADNPKLWWHQLTVSAAMLIGERKISILQRASALFAWTITMQS